MDKNVKYTQIEYNNYKATILHKGAELLQLSKNKTDYIWKIDEQYWNKTSPILFPIVGSLKNNSYTYNHQKYNLPRHGFARDFVFNLIHKTSNSATFSLQSNEETLQNYPFHFELQILYSLNETGLQIQYKIDNNSDNLMPFSLGAHPAFALEEAIDNYTLEFENDGNLTSFRIENELLSGKTSLILLQKKQLKLNYSLFETDAIVLKNNATGFIKVLKNNEPLYKVTFPKFPFLGIWTKKNAPFICIEPWLGVADSYTATGNILDKEGIIILNPYSHFAADFSIEIY